jgi:hypothetical protein
VQLFQERRDSSVVLIGTVQLNLCISQLGSGSGKRLRIGTVGSHLIGQEVLDSPDGLCCRCIRA